ncbi:MAG: hypothetical protein KDI24_03735 [Pseudomonadales bacterium]|nr:hypothetical protein [Pseudomonadales bacterium]
MKNPRLNICLVFLGAVALLNVSASYAEPELPAGVDEPGLPSGMEEPAMPGGLDNLDGFDELGREELGDSDGFDDFDNTDEDAWAFDESDASEHHGVSGFWELRAGHRLERVDNQRTASLAETRLELKQDWQWQGWSAKVTADFLYDDIEDSHHNDLESGSGWLDLRESWVEYRFSGGVDVKAGRQILTWGVGDLLFINDLFPKDWNSFLAGRDEQYLKAPSDALRIGYFSELFNINLIYSPRFDADRYIDGRRLSYFSPLFGSVVGQNGLLNVDKPEHSGSDDELALRIYRQIAGYEVALYGYQGFWKSPGGFNPLTGEAIFPELQVLGASARGALGIGIASVELGFYNSKDDSKGTNPFINNDEFRFLAGYEWEVAKDTTLGLQYYLEVLGDYDRYHESLLPGQQARDHYRQLITMRVTRLAMNQNLTLSLFLFYSPTDEDMYARPKVNYKINDNWAAEVGMNLFSGKNEYSFFGQFEDNSNLYGSIRYSF